MFISQLFESKLNENAEVLNVGDPVIIVGKVQFQGSTGEIAEFGKDKRFVVVNLYNHGRHSFHSSDVEYNDYADSDDEDMRMYDTDSQYRDWSHNQEVNEGLDDETIQHVIDTCKQFVRTWGPIEDQNALEYIASESGVTPGDVELILSQYDIEDELDSDYNNDDYHSSDTEDDLDSDLHEEGEEDLPPAANAQKTQIAGTLPTYKKGKAHLDTHQPTGKTLDFGAGLGGGAAEMGADSYEPFPRTGFQPTYTKSSEIPSDSYHRVTNFNVLNVVPQKIRNTIVSEIGRVLAPGGIAIITTRGKDVMTAKGKEGPEPMSRITSIGTYQKGFTTKELMGYVQQVLGQGFEVSPLKLGPAGVLVRKQGQEAVAEEATVNKFEQRRKGKTPAMLGSSDAWYHRGEIPGYYGFQKGSQEFNEYVAAYREWDEGPRGGKQW